MQANMQAQVESPLGKVDSQGIPSFKLFDSQDFSLTPTVAEVVPMGAPSNLAGSSEKAPILISPTAATPPPPPQANVLSKRIVSVPYFFRSPFILRNVDVLAESSQAEKDIADYAFSNLNNR